MGFLDKVPKVKTPEVPKAPALDPEVLEKINELIETVSDALAEDTSIGEIIEDEIKGVTHEKIMEQLEPHLDNDIVKKLADKAAEKAVDKSWDKIKQKLTKAIARRQEE